MSRHAPGRTARRPLLAAALATSLIAASLVVAGPASARGGGGGGGGGAAAPAPARLPADFPADISLPPGSLQGATGGAGRWSVLLLASGSAATVQSSTEAFYLARGFSRAGNAIVARGSERITILAVNRDHSATQTNLTLGVTKGAAGASPAAAPVATIVPGRARVSLARARHSGLAVRFTAPSSARSATARIYRTTAGGRRLLGSQAVALHDGTNSARFGAAAIRLAMRSGTYALEVVLRAAGGAAGRPASTVVHVVRTP